MPSKRQNHQRSDQLDLPGLIVAGAEKFPRLSATLKGPRDLTHCQRCGDVGRLVDVPSTAEAAMAIAKMEERWSDGSARLWAWREFGDNDRPEDRFLLLCSPCGDAIIDKHTRLYEYLQPGQPQPGVMPCCVGCSLAGRDFTCGAGVDSGSVTLTYPPPGRMHVCRSPRWTSGWITYYTGPVSCAERRAQG